MRPREFSLRREVLSVSTAELALVALRSSVAVALVWGLPSAAVGRYYALFLLGRVFATPANGVADTLRKRGSEARTDTRKHLALALAATFAYALVALVAAVGVALGLRGVALPVAVTLVDAAAIGALVAGFGALALLHALVDAWGFPGRSTWVRVGTEAAFLLLLLPVLATGVERAAPILFCYAGLSVAVLGLVLAVTRFPLAVPCRDSARSALRYAVWSVPAGFVGQLLSNYTTLLLAGLAGAVAAGWFKSASELTILGSYAAMGVIDPVFVRVSLDDSLDRDVVETVRTGVTYAPLVGLGAAAVILPLRRQLASTLLGTDARVVALVLGALAVAKAGFPFRQVFTKTLKALDRPDAVFRVRVGTAVVAVPLTAALIHTHGLVGGLAGYLARGALQLGALALIATRTLDRSPFTRTLAVECGGAVAVALGLAVVAPAVPAATGPVAVAATAGVASYVVALVALSPRVRAGIRATTADVRTAVARLRGRVHMSE